MSKKKSKTPKKLTVSELKAYIEGAVELNPEGWAPSHEQWVNIVEMIMNIKELPVQAVNSPVQPQSQPKPQSEHAQPPVSLAGPTLGYDNAQPPERMARPVDATQNPAVRPQVEKIGTQMAADPTTGTVSSGLKFKTPTIDTSKKPYTSGYE